MAYHEGLEYECLRCRFRERAEGVLVSTCRRCGSEMRNVQPIDG